MTRDLKYLTLGVGFLAATLVFSMAAAAGAIIIALPALVVIDLFPLFLCLSKECQGICNL
jgi:hypothetical protein